MTTGRSKTGRRGAEVRLLLPTDIEQSASLHREVFPTEFLARCGERFLRVYHLAWAKSPSGLALVAISEGQLVGVLLGALSPGLHFRWVARHCGARLALCLIERSLREPAFGRDLLATRAFRYTRGLVRTARRKSARPGLVSRKEAGEITHLMVSPGSRGLGVGAALVHAALSVAGEASVDEMVLVTPPGFEARGFYEHLGWQADGEVMSRSGEPFVRYRWVVRAQGTT